MKPGTYTGTVSVVPASGNSPQVVFVTLQIFSAGNITASPSTLSFIYQSGGQLPSPQVVNVLSSTGAAVPFTVTASTTVGTGWLSYSPTSGSTPTSIVVSVNPGSLGPGTYYGTINILPVGGNVAATQIPVSLTVPSSNQLVASPSNLYFTYQGGGPIPPIQYVSVTSTGAPISFKTTVTGPSWVVASPSSAITPVGVGVQVNPPAGTASGTYTAYITYAPNGPGNTATTTVTITVSAPNYISVSRNTVSFDYSPGGKTPPPAVIPVSSSGGPVHFDVIGSGASWLNVGQTSSTTPGNVVIGVSPQALTPGAYTASVTIVADVADNSPQAINVTLNVTDAALFTASPFALSFAYQIGRTPPPLQAIVIGSAGAALGFSASTSTDSGGSWLLIAGGGVTPATVGVAINTNSLGVGTYTGDVVLTPSDPAGRQLLVPVTLTVSPASVFVPTPAQVSFQYQRGGAAPAPQSVSVNTSSAVSIVYYPTSKTGDGGQWLSVTPATAVTPSPVTISVNPQGLAPGYYYGIVAFSDASGQAPTTWAPVTLQVTDNPVLTVNSQLLFFTSQVGGATPPTQQFTVGSGTATSFHVTPSGGTWLSATPTDGTTNGTVSVVASPATLTDGYYLGTVTVEIPGVDGSQQYVPVIFSVLPRS
jgi:hypothetical protein